MIVREVGPPSDSTRIRSKDELLAALATQPAGLGVRFVLATPCKTGEISTELATNSRISCEKAGEGDSVRTNSEDMGCEYVAALGCKKLHGAIANSVYGTESTGKAIEFNSVVLSRGGKPCLGKRRSADADWLFVNGYSSSCPVKRTSGPSGAGEIRYGWVAVWDVPRGCSGGYSLLTACDGRRGSTKATWSAFGAMACSDDRLAVSVSESLGAKSQWMLLQWDLSPIQHDGSFAPDVVFRQPLFMDESSRCCPSTLSVSAGGKIVALGVSEVSQVNEEAMQRNRLLLFGARNDAWGSMPELLQMSRDEPDAWHTQCPRCSILFSTLQRRCASHMQPASCAFTSLAFR
eukprot:SAG31_NODE_358_length_17033_cov_11.747077_4_plen_348_part_00